MADQESSTIEVRKPIKVLHFSDGVIEVFEDDEKKPEEPKKEEINESELSWTPWLLHKAQKVVSKFLSGVDYTGEKIADFLHITTPKYAYEIEQYKKEQAKKAQEEKELKDNTWSVDDEPLGEPITTAPSQSKNLEV